MNSIKDNVRPYEIMYNEMNNLPQLEKELLIIQENIRRDKEANSYVQWENGHLHTISKEFMSE